MTYPKLRPVEVTPVVSRGREMMLLRDAGNLSDRTVAVPPRTLFILSLLDGRHSLREIQVEYVRRFGDLILSQQLERLIQELDENLLLEGERFQQYRQEVEERFRALPFRPPAHAGAAYPADSDALEQEMKELMAAAEDTAAAREVSGAIAPHIDLRRGGRCYAAAYGAIACRPGGGDPPDLFIIFGTSHAGGSGPFILTSKNFATPLGEVETDAVLVKKLAEECGPQLLDDEIMHRGEHSIEFQVLFLKYLWREAGAFKILPVLCSGFHRKGETIASPGGDEELESFLSAVGRNVIVGGKKVCAIAGADLAHVGLRFGDERPLDLRWLAQIEEADRALLQRAEELDAEGFMSAIAADEDRRRICGGPPIYALLRTVKASRGDLLCYMKSVEQGMHSAVSFAAMSFSAEGRCA
jgi:hypothetical protein